MKLTHAALAVLALVSVSHAQQLAGSKPNIILVITDDQGYGPVGRHGHPWIKTPNLDKLYDTSVRFTRFLVSPTCAPTRSSIMTGRHPMQNGVTHTILERERMTLDATTLPQVLKTVGYTSGIFGKWHLGDEDPYQPRNRGFDEEFIHGAGGIGQAYRCSCADAPGNKYFNPTLRHNGKFVKTDGYCTNLFFNAALGWIKDVKDKDEPFFAYITTNAPHGPFVAPPENARRFTDLGFEEKTAGFYGMIENIDENMGLMLEKLDEWKLFENTVVIFMSDNGMTGGGSGRMGKKLGTSPDGEPMFPYNAGMKGLKGSAEEGGVRVPFFVRWDNHIPPNRDLNLIAAHIDILPTLAAFAGADIPADQVTGRSLLPLIKDERTVRWADRMLYTHVGRWKTGEEPNNFQWKRFSVRNNRFRMVGQQLFDLQADPSQKTDVAEQHPDIIKSMRASYGAWWKKTRPMMVNETAPMSKTKPFHEAYRNQKENGGIPKWKTREL